MRKYSRDIRKRNVENVYSHCWTRDEDRFATYRSGVIVSMEIPAGYVMDDRLESFLVSYDKVGVSPCFMI